MAARKLEQEIDRGVALHRAGQIAEARGVYLQLLTQYRDQPDLLRLLATAEHQLGNVGEAVKLFEKTLRLDPKQPDAHNNCGNALRDLERYEDALKHFDKAIALLPNYVEAYSNRGNALRALRRFDDALKDYDKALKLNPNLPQVHNNRGNTLRDLNRAEEALESFHRAIALNPNYAEAYNNRGNMFRDVGRTQEAMNDYNRAVGLNHARPESSADAELYNNRGNALRDMQQFALALQQYDKALSLKPDYAEAHSHRGVALGDLGKFEEALASHERAIVLQPDYAEAYNNRGNTLRDLNRMQDALESFNHAIALNPDFAKAYSNRGNALRDLGRVEEATQDYNHAVALKTAAAAKTGSNDAGDIAGSYDKKIMFMAPEFADGYWNKSVVKLLNGEFEEGWRLYEWRWKTQQFLSKHTMRPGLLWLGKEPLAGKTILIYPEQGLGDFIQFVRYVSQLEAMGANVLLEVPKPLIDIISSMQGNFSIIPAGAMLPDYNYQCPIMSLPHALGTIVETVPASIPYLYADVEKTAEWNTRLGLKNKPRVGLVWSGAAQHTNDHNRSISLSTLAPLLAQNFEFHCLQKEFRPQDEAQLAEFPQLKLHAKELHDFGDTAALIANLDLVISVDTSVAHIAAALGKPTWILLPFAPDYRWMLHRDDTPWYPNAKLFRQPKATDWHSVIQTMIEQLNTKPQE